MGRRQQVGRVALLYKVAESRREHSVTETRGSPGQGGSHRQGHTHPAGPAWGFEMAPDSCPEIWPQPRHPQDTTPRTPLRQAVAHVQPEDPGWGGGLRSQQVSGDRGLWPLRSRLCSGCPLPANGRGRGCSPCPAAPTQPSSSGSLRPEKQPHASVFSFYKCECALHKEKKGKASPKHRRRHLPT